LIAWDPVRQKEVWRVNHATMWNGGLLTTRSNLLFQGNSTGQFVAYLADSGEAVWQADVGNGIIAPPISYEVDGEQYIAVMAGWGGAVGLVFAQPGAVGGGPGRLLAYKLGGKAELPVISRHKELPAPPEPTAGDESVANGGRLYSAHCMRCHGAAVASNGAIADLRYMSEESHSLFKDIVLKGIFSPLGMIGFADVLSEQDAEDIHNYVISAANSKWEDELSPQWWLEIRDWCYDKLGVAISWFI